MERGERAERGAHNLVLGIMTAEKPAKGEPALMKEYFFTLQRLQVGSGYASRNVQR